MEAWVLAVYVTFPTVSAMVAVARAPTATISMLRDDH